MAGFRRGGSGHAVGMTGPGTLIADRYRVVRHLGSGAMASVYLADDELLGRQVAIKSVHADPKTDFGRRVLREARMGAALSHPNLVAVFDTIEVDDAVLLVMEYVPGRTLADALKEGRMAPDAALAILRPLAEAIDRTHGAGIVHRDVKPANVLLHERGDVKLADLGVATSEDLSRITRTGGVVGTAAYMAPEQFEAGPVDGGADVYALAAVAFEMLSGRRAFPAPDALAALVQRSQDVPDLRELVPDAPQTAATALQRGMALRPADRPITATALVDELEAAYRPRREPAAAPPPAPTPAPLAAASPSRRRAAPLAALGLLLVAGIVVAIVLAASTDDGEPSGGRAAAPQTQAQTTQRTETGAEPSTQAAPAIPAASDGSPAGAVRAFYERAAEDDFDGAWELAGPGLRAQFGNDRGTFEGTFRSLESVRFTRLSAADPSDTSATVALATTATHTDRTERCTGEAQSVRDGERWLVDRVGVRCTRANG